MSREHPSGLLLADVDRRVEIDGPVGIRLPEAGPRERVMRRGRLMQGLGRLSTEVFEILAGLDEQGVAADAVQSEVCHVSASQEPQRDGRPRL